MAMAFVYVVNVRQKKEKDVIRARDNARRKDWPSPWESSKSAIILASDPVSVLAAARFRSRSLCGQHSQGLPLPRLAMHYTPLVTAKMTEHSHFHVLYCSVTFAGTSLNLLYRDDALKRCTLEDTG